MTLVDWCTLFWLVLCSSLVLILFGFMLKCIWDVNKRVVELFDDMDDDFNDACCSVVHCCSVLVAKAKVTEHSDV